MSDETVAVKGLTEFSDALDDRIRRIAREEIASLAGLVLRRTQDDDEQGDDATARRAVAEIFGEVLNDFTTDTGPG